MMPFIRRNIVEPLYYKLIGSPRISYWKDLEKTQYLPINELRALQWERIKNLLAFVYENNLFYRDRFEKARIHPEDIRSTEDLATLPMLTKKQIRDNMHLMISKGYSVENLMQFKTGGSTGTSLTLYITEECSELRNACARRHDCWTGWKPGEPIGAVWGNPKLPEGLKARLRDWMLNPCIFLDTMNVSDQSVHKFASDWSKIRPTLLFGHAHSIYLLAEYIKKFGIDSIRPKGIISTSMMLMPNERIVIEEVFGVKVTDRYGCEEVSLIASECEMHDGMHLNIEHLFIEFIKDDGTSALPGEMGRLVVTDLMNRAMPFIRYEVEDVGIPKKGMCRCGRGLPLMEKIVGRTADFLVKKDGSRVAGISLIENTLTKIPGIEQMQIVQESLERFVINIVPGKGFTKESEDGLILYIQKIFEGNVRVKINILNNIVSGVSGKYRFSICNI
jgi:phenylacetate-CoA ligase